MGRTKIAPTLRLVMAEGAKHRDPTDQQAVRELRALLAVAREARRLGCDLVPGMRHDPNCPLCLALARLERASKGDGAPRRSRGRGRT